MVDQRLQWGLGWVSVGLGLTELAFAPGICRFFGVRRAAGLVRILGAHGLLTGLGLLSQQNWRPWRRTRLVARPDVGTYDGPRESWRGSGLAEDVGASARGAEPEADEEARHQRMLAAQRQLGLPDLEEQPTRT
jgi:hypothetical protein